MVANPKAGDAKADAARRQPGAAGPRNWIPVLPFWKTMRQQRRLHEATS